jgi:hypothetical protein
MVFVKFITSRDSSLLTGIGFMVGEPIQIRGLDLFAAAEAGLRVAHFIHQDIEEVGPLFRDLGGVGERGP